MKFRYLGITAVCFLIGIQSFADVSGKWGKGEKQQDGSMVYKRTFEVPASHWEPYDITNYSADLEYAKLQIAEANRGTCLRVLYLDPEKKFQENMREMTIQRDNKKRIKEMSFSLENYYYIDLDGDDRLDLLHDHMNNSSFIMTKDQMLRVFPKRTKDQDVQTTFEGKAVYKHQDGEWVRQANGQGAMANPTKEGMQSALEIHCSLSGGMRQVIYKNHIFTFIESIEKQDKSLAKSASLDGFVEIKKKTRLNKNQEHELRNWITKYKITGIKPVPKPEKEDIGMGAIRYPNRLMVNIDSKEYASDHRTIEAHPELQPAFDELFGMAKEFTETTHETSPANSGQAQGANDSKKLKDDLFQKDLDKATADFAGMMRNEIRFEFLAKFKINHPQRYALLLKDFEEKRKQGNNFGWEGAASDPYIAFEEYVNKLVENNQKYAQRSAIAWEKGWRLTIPEVIPKLKTKNFAGTRRIAIEFLKMKNNGEDFGYVWKDEPETPQNRSAISKWNEWLKKNK